MNKILIALIGAGMCAAASSTAHAQGPASVLFLNRCVGNCTVTYSGTDDARHDLSAIPNVPGQYTLTEWKWGDAQWNAVVQCVKEIYSPYNIEVVTDRPADTVIYNQQMVAGLGGELNIPQAGGVSSVEPCGDPATNALTFTFANGWGNFQGDQQQVWDICGVVGQETAHAFGLDHEYIFVDGRSSCSSPMTYRNTCGQQFFRNELAKCGEGMKDGLPSRPCKCNDPQNSHLRLLAKLGAGTPITKAPVITVSSPANGATVTNMQSVIANASAQRGIAFVELAVNGYTWLKVPGALWGANGQPAANYTLQIPPTVPDGVMDLVVTAKDDLEIATAAPTIRVTKGAPCTSAATCADGQRCDAEGRCLWDPPAGALGDACTFPQFCTSGLCNGIDGAPTKTCTQECVVVATDSCPMGFDCVQSNGGTGLCLPVPASSGGCCSTGSGAAAQSSLLGLALVLVLRRRRTATARR